MKGKHGKGGQLANAQFSANTAKASLPKFLYFPSNRSLVSIILNSLPTDLEFILTMLANLSQSGKQI